MDIDTIFDETQIFLKKLIETFDELANRTAYFKSKLSGEYQNYKNNASNSKKEFDTMKYKSTEIKKRTDGRWYGRIKIENGIYHDVYAKSQLDCYEKIKQLTDNPKLLIKKLPIKADNKKILLKDYFDIWLKTYKVPNCATSTIRNAKNVFKNHISNTKIAAMKIDTIQSCDIQETLNQIQSITMRKKSYIMLSDIFSKAKLQKIIKEKPTTDIIKPKIIENNRRAFFEEEEIEFVNIAKNNKYWIIFALMLYEGLRPGEAKALRHCDIKEKYIIVDKSMNDVGEIVETKTKTIRNIPIFEQFKSLAIANRSESKKTLIENPNKHSANNEFYKIIQKLNIDIQMYSLRHTFATRCAEAEINPKQVQQWMGHKDVETTLKYYTHISKKFENKNTLTKSNFDTNFDTNLT